jgi:predicted DNA-binding antitoxin AbrB/MazE fold protein
MKLGFKRLRYFRHQQADIFNQGVHQMYQTIKGIYKDGIIRPLEPIPVKEDVEVTITFLIEAPELEDIGRLKSEKDILEEWTTRGLVKTPLKGIKKTANRDHPPVSLKGKPLSQIIIEERGIR